MDARKLLVLLLIGFGLVLPYCAGATTYKLPVTTATLSYDWDNWHEFINGEPISPYNFEIDPAVLRVGSDPATHLMYETIMVFDWQELYVIPEGARVIMELYFTSVSVPEEGFRNGAWTTFGVDYSVPIVSDFDWEFGIGMWGFGVSATQPTVLPLGAYPYTTIRHYGYSNEATALYGGYPVLEIAGINNGLGLEAPYVLVTTVPEPSSLSGLGVAVLSLGGLVGAARKRRLTRAVVIVVLSLIVVMSGHVMAQEEYTETDSDPGSAGMSLSGMPMPGTRDLPEDFKVLPAFPRLFWSFGCAPTTGAMIAGYSIMPGFRVCFGTLTGRMLSSPPPTIPATTRCF